MKMGHIDVEIIKILIVGGGGVGKSCFFVIFLSQMNVTIPAV